jgi:hypothetical protein
LLLWYKELFLRQIVSLSYKEEDFIRGYPKLFSSPLFKEKYPASNYGILTFVKKINEKKKKCARKKKEVQ